MISESSMALLTTQRRPGSDTQSPAKYFVVRHDFTPLSGGSTHRNGRAQSTHSAGPSAPGA
ncbi:MAG TPA: hypothetical protein VHD35_13005 [Chitinophagaceae bacterium]|nr:hypothetical protein [Chitinophagaceae bacterium]HVZ95674.1 hypothetical protein [Chitinophagaceae bacterium]